MLRSRIPQITVEMVPAVRNALWIGAGRVADSAKQRVPIGAPSVHLRDAIHVEEETPLSFAVIAGDNEAFYGHMVEYGTSHSAPRPFLTPALAERTPEVVKLVRAALGRL